MRDDDVVVLCFRLAHIYYQNIENQNSNRKKSDVYDSNYFRICFWNPLQDNFGLRLGELCLYF